MDKEPKHHESMTQGCYRMSAPDELRRLARCMRDKAHWLEKLADEAGRLSPDADAILWELAQRYRD